MKSLHYYKKQILAVGLLGTLPILTYAQNTVLPAGSSRLDYSASRVERSVDGKTLQIGLNVKPTTDLKRQEVVCVYPYYASADGSKRVDLEPVFVAGNRRYKVIERRKALRNIKPGDPGNGKHVYAARHLKGEGISRQQALPFEAWMADGYLAVKEQVYGCAECGVNEYTGMAYKSRIPLFSEKDYAYNFIEPEQVEVKCYTDSFNCKVSFRVARHDLQRSFADNGVELERLEKFISDNLGIKGTELKEVVIKGYASPEGKADYNKRLAERRTRTLSDYVSNKYPELKEAPAYRTEGVGEDWEGLKAAIKAASLPNAEALYAIINRLDSDTDREDAIRSLDNGETYNRLLRNLYPALRRTTFGLRFDVRQYGDNELEEAFHAKPQCMSQYEMYRLAEQRAARGENPIAVYKQAYNQFTGDVVAALNYANALLKYDRNADAALQVLQPWKNNAYAVLPLAIAHHMKGDSRQAESILGNSRGTMIGK